MFSESQLYIWLYENGINYQRFEHPAVFTCEEAEMHLPGAPGMGTKNLFLRDKKGTRHLLVTVGDKKRVNLKALEEVVGATKLGFASADRLQKYLGLSPGSVTVLGLLNDPDNQVEFYIDRELWDGDHIQCHPLVNTATVVLTTGALKQILAKSNRKVNVIDIPGGRVEK